MIKYISSSSLPLYQIQIIRKDLLGMAQEAERQELPLKDMLGVEPREFCDEIIENAATPARKERAFQVVIDVLQPFAIYFTFMWTCGGMPSRFGITLTDIIAFLGLCGICRGLMRYMGNRLAIKGSPILNLLPYLFLPVYGSSDRHRRAFRFRLCGRNVCDIRPRPFHGHPGGCDCHRSDAFMEPYQNKFSSRHIPQFY